MAYPTAYDLEKNQGYSIDDEPVKNDLTKPRDASQESDGAVPGDSFEYGNSTYAKLHRVAGKFKIELRGIERVPEDERTDSGLRALLNVATMVCAGHA